MAKDKREENKNISEILFNSFSQFRNSLMAELGLDKKDEEKEKFFAHYRQPQIFTEEILSDELISGMWETKKIIEGEKSGRKENKDE